MLFPQILDRDLQDMAHSCEAITEKREIFSPEEAPKLHMLMRAMEINGQDAEEFLESGKVIFAGV